MNGQKAPVFVKIEDYKDIMDLLSLIKEKLSQARFLLGKINELKNQEDAELASWEKDLDDVASMVSDVDRMLIEPEL
ncbi:MAG: hypothetical protein QW666_01575 [Candidatus Woesearchaeota archaeon]